MPDTFSFDLMPILPIWAIALACAAMLALLIQGSITLLRKRVPARWVAALGLLRLAIIALFAVCLLAPVLSFNRHIRKKPDLMVMIDTSRSMALPSVGRSDESRLAAAMREMESHRLLDRLAGDFDLHYFAFDDGARRLARDEVASLQPTGPTTRLARSITDALQALRDQSVGVDAGNVGSSGPVRMLLVSDGRDAGSTDASAVASSHDLPVDYLALPQDPDSQPEPAAVRITTLQAQPRVLLGSDAGFLVTLIREDDRLGQDLTLALAEDGKAVATQAGSFPAGHRETTVRIEYRPAQRGLHAYRVVLLQGKDQADAKAIEARSQQPEAGAHELTLAVVDRTLGVLGIEGSYRWSFRYFKRLMEDDPSFGLTSMLARGGGSYTRFAEPDNQMDVTRFPQSAGELGAVDIIVLGDANPRHWPAGLPRALADAVARDGKSLVVVAGPNLAHWMAYPDLLALLPVDITADTARPLEGPVEVRLTDEARSSAFFADGAGVFNQALPAVDFIYPPVRKRPAATVLLEATGVGTQQGRVIVMAEHTVGRGRVLYVGTDTLWKWQLQAQPTQENVTPYTLFWQQAMRAMAPLQRSDAPLLLTFSRSRYEQGQRVELQARIPSSQLQADSGVQGTLTLPDGQSTPLSFMADVTSPGVFTANFQASQAGAYRLDASAVTQGQAVAQASAGIDIAPLPDEDAHLGVDQALLDRLATATAGVRVVAGDDSTWPRPAKDLPVRFVTRTWHLDLWNHYVLLIALMALLGADWLIRLLRGYV